MTRATGCADPRVDNRRNFDEFLALLTLIEPGSIDWATVSEAQRFRTSKNPREYCPGRTGLGGDYFRFDTVRGFFIDEATLRDTCGDIPPRPADHPCGSHWGTSYEDP